MEGKTSAWSLLPEVQNQQVVPRLQLQVQLWAQQAQQARRAPTSAAQPYAAAVPAATVSKRLRSSCMPSSLLARMVPPMVTAQTNRAGNRGRQQGRQ